ncbi:MAG TPA: hypothetical protein VFR32_10120 [Gaiellaceae bacterium]|nr:hypothetical protein [Gaiellaceae bacterium]
MAIGGGVVYAAPFMTSAALAGSEDGNPRCNAVVGPDGPVTCGPDGCFDQTNCSGSIPDGSVCSCVPREPGNGNERGGGQCFCHEVQFCAGLTACESSGDCPPGWACTSSCCPDGPWCLPPCGTNPVFGLAGLVAAESGTTTVG